MIPTKNLGSPDYCSEIIDELETVVLSDFSNIVQFTYVSEPEITESYDHTTNYYTLAMDFDTYDIISKYQVCFIPVDEECTPIEDIAIYKTPLLYAPRVAYEILDDQDELVAVGIPGKYYRTANDQQMWGYNENTSAWENKVFINILLERILGGVIYIPYIMFLLESGVLYEYFGVLNIHPAVDPDYDIATGTFSLSYNEDSVPVIEVTIYLSEPVTDYQLVLKRKVGNDGEWKDLCIYSEPLETIRIVDYLCPNEQTDTEGLYYGISVINNLKVEGEITMSGTLLAASEMNSNIIAGINAAGSLQIYRLIAKVDFGEMKMTNNAGMQDTLGGLYPFYIKNSKAAYYKSSISGMVIENFDRCLNQLAYPNRKLLEDRRKEFLSFLGNGFPKVLRTWNGDVMVISVLEGIGYSPDNELGGTLGRVSFEYVEVSAPDDYTTLADLGINEDLLVVIIEGEMNEGISEFTKTGAGAPLTPDTYHIYYDTETDIYYRWTGTAYVVQHM